MRFSKGALKAISITREGCVSTLDLWNISERHEKNGGEGGSFNCGNVLAHCQSFFYFVKGQVIYHLVHRELWLLRFFGMTQTRQ